MPEPTTKAADPTTSTDEGKNSAGAEAAGAGTQTAKTEDAKKTELTPEQQAAVQAEVQRIVAKERKAEREKVEKEASEAKAKEQGEFQKLYDELKPKHDALTAEAKQYRATVRALVTAELAGLPQEVRGIAPVTFKEDGATISNPLDVLAWLPQAKALAAKLEGAKAAPGAGPDPKPKGAPGDAAADEKARKAQAGLYRHF